MMEKLAPYRVFTSSSLKLIAVITIAGILALAFYYS